MAASSARRPPVLAGVAVIVGLVLAGGAGLVVVERGARAPQPASYVVALPERPPSPATEPTGEVPLQPVPETVVTPLAPVPERPAAPRLAATPGLTIALSGLAWNPALADIAHRALAPSLAFVVPVDHPALSERLGVWRGQGRDVLLMTSSTADIDELLQAHPRAAGVVDAARDLHLRRAPEPFAARVLDAAVMDYAGFTAALREAMGDARTLPPPVVVIELYPGLVPQLQAWLDQLERGGFRLWRALELPEASGE